MAPTIAAFLESFLGYLRSQEKSPATIRNYRQHWTSYIAPVIGDVRLSDLSQAHFAKVLSKCDDVGLGTYTKRQVIATLNRGLSVAQDLDVARQLPRCPQIRRPEHDLVASAFAVW